MLVLWSVNVVIYDMCLIWFDIEFNSLYSGFLSELVIIYLFEISMISTYVPKMTWSFVFTLIVGRNATNGGLELDLVSDYRHSDEFMHCRLLDSFGIMKTNAKLWPYPSPCPCLNQILILSWIVYMNHLSIKKEVRPLHAIFTYV